MKPLITLQNLLLVAVMAALLAACTAAPAASPAPASPSAGSTPAPAAIPKNTVPSSAETQPPAPPAKSVIAVHPTEDTAIGAYITVPDQPTQTTGEAGTVNLRGGPGTTYPIVGKLQQGAVAQAVGREGEWIMITDLQAPEGAAWVYAPLVILTGELRDLRTPAVPTP
jgi:uncharacterized protein YgiM (DUF1202 family)